MGTLSGQPICGSGGRCVLRYSKEYLPEFPFLCFWLDLPAPVLLCPALGKWKSVRCSGAGMEWGDINVSLEIESEI